MKCPKCGGEFEVGMCEVFGGDQIAGLYWYPGLTKDELEKNPQMLGRESIRIRGPTYVQMFFCQRCPGCKALFLEYGKTRNEKGGKD